MHVIAGMSGGVDSTVAALLLRRAGHNVEGLFMQNWDDDGRSGPCTTDADRKDAVAVCGQIGIPFHARNFAHDYWDHVFTQFLDEYRAGRTPNPDVACNREIKFKTFLDAARELGADKIATGHYARVRERDGRWQLLRAVDTAKDQSYFLHAIGQEALAKTLFPIGELTKPAVRRIAADEGLVTSAKKDSTGICFIGERKFHAFLANYIPARPGEMRHPDGRLVGHHDGVMYYTLGQRQGLRIGGRADGIDAPWYVVGKDVPRNVLYVVQGDAGEWLQSHRLRAGNATWIDGAPPARNFAASAKVRYRQPDQRCHVLVHADSVEVVFDAPQRAVTPGQSVVFYQDEVCLGGAVIDATDAQFGGWT